MAGELQARWITEKPPLESRLNDGAVVVSATVLRWPRFPACGNPIRGALLPPLPTPSAASLVAHPSRRPHQTSPHLPQRLPRGSTWVGHSRRVESSKDRPHGPRCTHRTAPFDLQPYPYTLP
jgi:hypothetical protein